MFSVVHVETRNLGSVKNRIKSERELTGRAELAGQGLLLAKAESDSSLTFYLC